MLRILWRLQIIHSALLFKNNNFFLKVGGNEVVRFELAASQPRTQGLIFAPRHAPLRRRYKPLYANCKTLQWTGIYNRWENQRRHGWARWFFKYSGPPRLLQFWYRSLWYRSTEINYRYSYNISHFLRPWRGMKLFHRQRCMFCSVWMRKRRYRRKKFWYKSIDEPSKSPVYCLTIIILWLNLLYKTSWSWTQLSLMLRTAVLSPFSPKP